MFRRAFIQRITVAGASSFAAVATVKAAEDTAVTVTYAVKGFSCITCAVGLEVMLRQQKGVVRAKASYPEAIVMIRFDRSILTEASLKEFITTKGFTVEEQVPTKS